MKWFKHRLSFDDEKTVKTSSKEPQIIKGTFRSIDFDSTVDNVEKKELPPIRIRSSVQHQKILLPPKKLSTSGSAAPKTSATNSNHIQSRFSQKYILPESTCKFIAQSRKLQVEKNHTVQEERILNNGKFKLIYFDDYVLEKKSKENNNPSESNFKDVSSGVPLVGQQFIQQKASNEVTQSIIIPSTKSTTLKKNEFLHQVATPSEMPNLKNWNTLSKNELKSSISSPTLINSTVDIDSIKDNISSEQYYNQSEPSLVKKANSHNIGNVQNTDQEKKDNPLKKSKGIFNLFTIKSNSKTDIEKNVKNIESNKIQETKNENQFLEDIKNNDNSKQIHSIISNRNNIQNIRMQNNIGNAEEAQIPITDKPKKIKTKKIRVLKKSTDETTVLPRIQSQNTMKNSKAIQSKQELSLNRIESKTPITSNEIDKNVFPEDNPLPTSRSIPLPVPSKRSTIDNLNNRPENAEVPVPKVRTILKPKEERTDKSDDMWNLVAQHRLNTRSILNETRTVEKSLPSNLPLLNEKSNTEFHKLQEVVQIKSNKPKTMREMKQEQLTEISTKSLTNNNEMKISVKSSGSSNMSDTDV